MSSSSSPMTCPSPSSSSSSSSIHSSSISLSPNPDSPSALLLSSPLSPSASLYCFLIVSLTIYYAIAILYSSSSLALKPKSLVNTYPIFVVVVRFPTFLLNFKSSNFGFILLFPGKCD